jgi:hypothetical protein
MPLGPKKPNEREPDEQPGEDRELSLEEQLLAEKARVAAAKREAERRGQAQEISDFLEAILAPESEEAPAEPAGPGVGMVLTAEPEERGARAAPAPAPFAGDAAPAEAPAKPRPSAGEGQVGRTLSSSLAATYLELQSLGRGEEAAEQLNFEPEEPSSEFSRNVTALRSHPRRPAALAFEPEEAARAAGPAPASSSIPGSESSRPTAILARSAEPGAPAPGGEGRPPPAEPGPEPSPQPGQEASLEDQLRLADQEPPPAAIPDAAAQEEEKSKAITRHLPLPGAALADEGPGAAEPPPAAAPAPEPSPPDAARYSLDDLPAAPPTETPQEPAEGPSEIEPAMADAGDDEAGLREALAAAEAAARATTLGELSVAAVVAAGRGPQPAAAPPPKEYSIADLPEAPAGAPRAQGDEPERQPAGDDRISEEKIPELIAPPERAAAQLPPRPAAPAAPAAPTRAADGAREAQVGRAAGGGPVPAPVAAENAADLSAQQLAAVERYIVSQVDAEPERPKPAGLAAPGPRPRPALNRMAEAVRKGAGRVVKSLDRLLEPYGLSCKRLLGIAGILILAGMAAYILKTWVLPGMHRGP